MSDDVIRVDHLSAYTGGWVGLTFTPGKHGPGLDKVPDRDLDADIATLHDAYAIDTFVWLIEDHEVPMLNVERLPDAMAAAGIEVLRHPIVDVNVPTNHASFRVFLDDLHRRLANGERVAIACRGGCGRTGVVAACLLVDKGMDADAAIKATRKARSCTIEVPVQERFVRDWEWHPPDGLA